MNKILRLSFSLKNTYRVNSILYSLKQLPLIKRILPDMLYGVTGLKIFANIVSVFIEVFSVFAGKLLYFLTMVAGAAALYENAPKERVFLHILLFLTVIGSFMNTHIFNPTRDKYYAVILMRMDARGYTLVNYGYSVLKVIVGFLPFSLIFGSLNGVPLWFCFLIPFSVAGAKITAAAYTLWDYERRGNAYNENKLSKFVWSIAGILLAAAYGLPAAGLLLPDTASLIIMTAFIPAGIISAKKIVAFGSYSEINRELLSQMMTQIDTAKQAAKKSGERSISDDTAVTSGRKGFEYLNELFIKRHQKILWKAAKSVSYVCLFLVLGALLALYLAPQARGEVNELILNWLPYFVFIMYAINRGTGFTRALFMNCDHSLLTYSFYKQPKFVLKLFKIRLREIIKINAVPAAVIGAGLSLILFASGGTSNPLNYAVLFVSILSMSVFFSVHYLTIYYLLQPYNAGTEIKSATYQLVLSVTYLVCFLMMQLKMPILAFGICCIAFCILYSVIACVLVYRFAPRTFRLRA